MSFLFKHQRRTAQNGSLVDHSHIPSENGGLLLSSAMAVPGSFCLRRSSSNFHKCPQSARTFVQSSVTFLTILPRRLYSHREHHDAQYLVLTLTPFPCYLSTPFSTSALNTFSLVALSSFSLLDRPP